ncbi:MAG: SAM-dependent DNA methyltransferase [Burkholderiales bacterium]|nr:SAM-dependent DNA methyltransferase [Burkholderiales bacterium]
MPGAKKNADTAATVGYEAQLWQIADALRGSMDAAEYKHVCLGLLFLKYIFDAFEEKHAALLAEKDQGADPEDPDEYRAQGAFWVPLEARWQHLKTQARQSTIGQLVDDAMAGIECDNPALKGVLPKDYARPALDKQRLGQLIDMISNIRVGDEASRAKDVLGRVYEYFLSQFASAEGKKGGEFYTPRCVVKLLVEMLEPYRGRVYDPCCGSSGMFVQSVEFIRAHAKGNGNGGKARADISIYGQKSNHAWRGEKEAGEYADVPGFCKSAELAEVRKHGHVLTPGRYVGAEAKEDDGEPLEEKMKRLAATLREQQAEAARLDAAIAANLKELGFWERTR